MTVIQSMAWFVVLLSVVKLAVVLVKPRVWMEKVVKPIYGHGTSQWIFLLIALGGFYYLLPSLTAAQFFATLFVFMFLMMAGFIPYAKDVLPSFETLYRDRAVIWKKSWPVTLVWVALLVWAIANLAA